MRLREQPSSLILSLVAVVLAALVGLLVSISGSATRGSAHLDWTPPVKAMATTPAPRRTSTATARPSATRTRVPTRAPSPTPELSLPIPTATRTTTPLPTPTPTPSRAALARIVEGPVNLRSGPSTDAGVIGLGMGGEVYDIFGRSEDNDWVQLCCLKGEPFWVAAELAEMPAAIDSYPVVR